MYCNKCGYQNSENAKFCQKCGNELLSQNSQNILTEKNVDDSIIRRSIKLDAKKKQKAPLYGVIFIILIVGIVLSAFLIRNISTSTMQLETNISGNQIIMPLLLLFIYFFVAALLNISIAKASLDISREKQITIGDILRFPFHNFSVCLKMIGVGILVSIILGVLQLAPIIGTIAYLILLYYYAPAYVIFNYIMVDSTENNLSVIDAIKKAIELVKGQRIAFYGLVFSFLGWYLLSAVTLGTLLIWVLPYLNVSLANYYRRLIKEKEFTSATTGLSNKAIIGICFGATFALIIVMIIIVAIGILINTRPLTTEKTIPNNLYEDTYENNNTNYEDIYDSGEVRKATGVNIYVPNEFSEIQIDGYTNAYASPSKNTVLGVIVQEIQAEQTSLDDYANTMRYLMSEEYTCDELQTKTLNGEDWKILNCQNAGYNVRCYIIIKGTTGYIIAITYKDTSAGNTELLSKIEQNLSIEY